MKVLAVTLVLGGGVMSASGACNPRPLQQASSSVEPVVPAPPDAAPLENAGSRLANPTNAPYGPKGGTGPASSAHAGADAAFGEPSDEAGVASAEEASNGNASGEPAGRADAGAAGATQDMLLVPGGSFTMGADHGGQEDEHPAHTVTIPSFWLDRTEVTNQAYELCVTAGVCRPHDPTSASLNHFGSDAPFRGPSQPISCVSWDDARTYCEHLGKRLPTEAEWEKAARGTDARRYPWGDTATTHELAVFETDRTADVGTHPDGAGPYGHLDLAGNVWEWVADIYDPYAYRRAGAAKGIGGTCEETLAALKELRDSGRRGFTGSNPIPIECERVLRGGAFNYDGNGLRSSNRVHHPGRFRLIMSGFRCAKDAEPRTDPP